MTNISFLILHYRTLKDTRLCISSIDQLDQTNCNVQIVVVDNFSKDGSYEQLCEDYASRNDITLLTSDSNLGFSKGNNLGYCYIREHFSPDYIIMTNSDIDFRQKDFLQRMIAIGKSKNFSVLGPDINAFRLGIHQNPVRADIAPLESQREELQKQKDYYQWLLDLEKSGETTYPFSFREKIYRLLSRLHIQTFVQQIKVHLPFLFPSYLSYRKEYENVMLHGSCMIFSKRYIDKYPICLFPEPFFYGEEDLLLLKARRNQDKICYDPSLTVWHLQDASVSSSKGADNQISKAKFKYENYISTKSLFIEVMENEHYFDSI